jgi:hypothetical protein
MTAILIISLAVYITYKISVIRLFGVPASVSETFYLFNDKKNNLGYLFTLWCYLIGISVMIVMTDCSEGTWYQFLSFLSGGALCFVGTAPLFKGHEKVIHYVSASVCAVSALAWMFLDGCWIIPFGMILIYLLFSEASGKGRLIFYLESGVFEATYTVLLMKLFLHI